MGGLVSLSACVNHIWIFCRKKWIKMILLLVNHDIHTSNSCLVLRFLRGQTQVTAGKSLFFKYLCQYIFIKKRAFEYINYWFFILKYCFKYEMQNKKNLKFKWRAGVCFRRNGKCFLVAKESVFIGAIAMHMHMCFRHKGKCALRRSCKCVIGTMASVFT